MSILRVGLGHSEHAAEAARTAMESTDRPDFVLVFASSNHEPHETYLAVKEQVGDTNIFGGTSAGEFSSIIETPVTDSVVVMTLQSSYLSVGIGVGHNLKEDASLCGREAIQKACAAVRPNPAVMSLMTIALNRKDTSEVSRIKPFVNVILPDGTTGQEEAFMRAVLQQAGTASPVVGGSSANDFTSDRTYQFGNGVYRNSGIIATLSSGLKMGTAMGHPYFPTSRGAVVTKAEGRVVHQLNNQSAVETMKALVGVSELNSDVFAEHPVGIKSSDVFGEYTIKSAASANEDGSITFLAEVPEGAYLRDMQSDAGYARASFRKTLERAIADAGNPKKIGAIIIFNCILRHLLKCRLDVNDLELVREVVGDVPVIGFNTFGEQGMTMGGAFGHYNQTATVLVIAEELITQ